MKGLLKDGEWRNVKSGLLNEIGEMFWEWIRKDSRYLNTLDFDAGIQEEYQLMSLTWLYPTETV